jgi:hypothetical protein
MKKCINTNNFRWLCKQHIQILRENSKKICPALGGLTSCKLLLTCCKLLPPLQPVASMLKATINMLQPTVNLLQAVAPAATGCQHPETFCLTLQSVLTSCYLPATITTCC